MGSEQVDRRGARRAGRAVGQAKPHQCQHSHGHHSVSQADDASLGSKWCNNVLRALCPFCGTKKSKGRTPKGCKYLHLDDFVEWGEGKRQGSAVRNLMFEHMDKLRGHTVQAVEALGPHEAARLQNSLAALGWNGAMLSGAGSASIVASHLALLLHCHSVRSAPAIAIDTLRCLFNPSAAPHAAHRSTPHPPSASMVWCSSLRRAACHDAACPHVHIEDITSLSGGARQPFLRSLEGTPAEYLDVAQSVALCQGLIAALRESCTPLHDVLWNYFCNEGWKPQAMGLQSSQEKVEFVLLLACEGLHMMGAPRVPQLVFDTFAVVGRVLAGAGSPPASVGCSDSDGALDGTSAESVSSSSGLTPSFDALPAEVQDVLPPLDEPIADDMTDLLSEVAAMCERIKYDSAESPIAFNSDFFTPAEW